MLQKSFGGVFCSMGPVSIRSSKDKELNGMKITTTGRKVNLRDNFKNLAQKKLSRFDRIFDEDAEANVVVTVEKNRQTVEVTIRQPRYDLPGRGDGARK